MFSFGPFMFLTVSVTVFFFWCACAAMAPQAKTDSSDVIDPLNFLKPIGLTQYR
jgi:hypothetical protein